MPLELNRPDRWDDDNMYIEGYQEDEDFSDIDSDSSDVTTRSMSTLNSVEVNTYFREVYGRAYPADKNIPAFVPLDNGEAARLEIQHHYTKLMVGSNYFGPVREILQPHPTRRKRVLDLLTGDGTWAQEMATEFPHVDFVSLDMIPLVPHTPRPNVSFEVYDVYNGFAEPDATFDIVHARRTVTQFRDYHAFLCEVHRVLRPGGLLLFGQIEIEVYEYTAPNPSSPNDPGETLFPGPHVIPGKDSLPVMTHGMQLLRESLGVQQVQVEMWRQLPELLAPDSPLWQSHPREHDVKPNDVQPYQTRMENTCIRAAPGFKGIVTQIHIYPTTGWHHTPRLRALGEIVQQVGEWSWRNFGLLFRQVGRDEKEIDALIEAGQKERTSLDIWQVMRYHTVYATKL
ncbi:unnamed protein product [Rhizoctonia solani]|uniref:Methyltransferase domain-containing protein n=1 Tax=Rhizoctonia solani TaxID=456999 RepID=A0A8H3BRJ6_9AGAM|nr:unnamed protein product [Rhizoctonia solani]CAE6476864.1 unnamed protein product [Rhizoctonia solani]